MEECKICNTPAEVNYNDFGERIYVNCQKCGEYTVTRTALKFVPFQKYINWGPILGFWIRNHKKSDKVIELDRAIMLKVLEQTKLPKPKEQAENFLLWLGNSLNSPSEQFDFDANLISSIIGAVDVNGVKYIVEHLDEEQYIKASVDSSNNISVYMTFKGWERFDEIIRNPSEDKICFMAMKFGDELVDKIYFNHLKKVVISTGFELRRLDETLKAGLIDDQLRVEIRKARFMIAELTNANNGAYWESGFAEGLGKPVIYLCKKDIFNEKKTHFDTNHLVTITWEEETIDDDIKNLVATIRATFPNEAILLDNN